MTWKPAKDDKTPQEKIVYEIFWSTTRGGEDFSNPALVSAPDATEAVVGGFVGEPEEYRFVVRARDEAGNRDDNTVEVTSDAGFDRVPPAFAGCKSAAVSGTTGILVEWDAASDSVTPASELVYRVWVGSSEPAALNHSRPPDQTVTGGTAALFETLFRGTSYYFSCEAGDAAGNRDGNQVTKTVVIDAPPTKPSCGPEPREFTSTTVNVDWCLGWDDVTLPGDLAYLITFTEVDTGAVFQVEIDQGRTQTILTGLSPNALYDHLQVQTRDGRGQLSDPQVGQYYSFGTAPTFAAQLQPAFDAQCVSSGCHDSTTQAAGLNLTAGNSYANLMLPATQGAELGEPGILRVKSRYSDESYLVRKVCNYSSDYVGEQMPRPGGDYELCTMILRWITSGAPND